MSEKIQFTQSWGFLAGRIVAWQGNKITATRDFACEETMRKVFSQLQEKEDVTLTDLIRDHGFLKNLY